MSSSSSPIRLTKIQNSPGKILGDVSSENLLTHIHKINSPAEAQEAQWCLDREEYVVKMNKPFYLKSQEKWDYNLYLI